MGYSAMLSSVRQPGVDVARNIEIKARVGDPDQLAKRVAGIASGRPCELWQDDTFFLTPRGRLKLRDFGDGRGELIYYERADRTGPGESFYRISPTRSPDSLRTTLSLALGERGRVRKRRVLYHVGRTRIHLDDVEGLGHFMELEVVLAELESAGDGQREAQRLMNALGIENDALVEVAYIDLLSGEPDVPDSNPDRAARH